MAANTRLVLFANGALYLTPNSRYEIAQTNLAQYSPKFKATERRYFEVECTYEKEGEKLEMRITSHAPDDTTAFAEQHLKSPVKHISITGFRWMVLDAMVYTYIVRLQDAPFVIDDTRRLKQVSMQHPLEYSSTSSRVADSPAPASETHERPREQKSAASEEQPERAPLTAVTGIFNEVFDYSFARVEFCDGYVTIAPKFSWHNETIVLRIANEKLFASFGYIRGYFANILGIGETISISAIVEMVDGEVVQNTATCKDISAIKDELLELVKQRRMEDIISEFTEQKSKETIVTADVLLDGAPGGNLFAQSADDVVRVILLREDIRNKRQLQYLAAEKHDVREKLRFTLGRDVGFLFYIEGDSDFTSAGNCLTQTPLTSGLSTSASMM